ncbi:hypothetical protein ASPVEDRAFT_37465 [Aspergillus versicolor CBS 583.65]|uniref:Uncharacterized protein n=1 Tax=Aspergillus versicolor CBS 583.65 TaxID=1036611 RepID=A0A1L9P9A7_ASPVE|nr:uncharacterized protein ASPVEDRAFT_37465 [Aspergillus versicolor CBS 583.65]OJI98024.1 hypothetical protein ASPVEDRAFT_37465 [Aspergillus versicolor CBS 583.65]
MPIHYAVRTERGVTQLGLDTMHIEIEVEAHDPEGALPLRARPGRQIRKELTGAFVLCYLCA